MSLAEWLLGTASDDEGAGFGVGIAISCHGRCGSRG